MGNKAAEGKGGYWRILCDDFSYTHLHFYALKWIEETNTHKKHQSSFDDLNIYWEIEKKMLGSQSRVRVGVKKGGPFSRDVKELLGFFYKSCFYWSVPA